VEEEAPVPEPTVAGDEEIEVLTGTLMQKDALF
jgi:hypothetical protein